MAPRGRRVFIHQGYITISGIEVTLPVSISAAVAVVSTNISSVAAGVTFTVVTGAANLGVDLKAQSIGNISIDIAAQSLGTVDVNIAAAAVSITVTGSVTITSGTVNILQANFLGEVNVRDNIVLNPGFNMGLTMWLYSQATLQSTGGPIGEPSILLGSGTVGGWLNQMLPAILANMVTGGFWYKAAGVGAVGNSYIIYDNGETSTFNLNGTNNLWTYKTISGLSSIRRLRNIYFSTFATTQFIITDISLVPRGAFYDEWNSETNTPLAVGAAYTCAGRCADNFKFFGLTCYADQDGRLIVQDSDDNTSFSTLATYSVSATTRINKAYIPLRKWIKLTYSNGGVEQSNFFIKTTLKG